MSAARTIVRRRALPALLAAALALGAAGCPPAGNIEARCVATTRTRPAVMVRLAFVRQAEGETAVEGFDLDDRVSTAGDITSCRQADFTAPDGTRGIDNQLAILLPVVDSMTGGALEGAVQGAINNGQLLLALSVEDVDDNCSDDEVTLVIQRVAGTPFVGSDMLLDPNQTFDAQRDDTPTRVRARIHNGELEAGPFTLPLPVAVLTARFTLNLYNARVRLRLTDDGGLDGYIGGGIDREEFMAEVRQLIIGQSLMNSISGALTVFADLDRDSAGHCQRLSAAVRVIARPAFINP